MNFKSKVKLFLSLLFLIINNNHIYAQTTTENTKPEQTKANTAVDVDKESLLNNNHSWIRIKEIWHNLININDDPLYQKFKNTRKNDNEDFRLRPPDKNWKSLDTKYSSEKDELSNLLDALVRQNLLSAEEKKFIVVIYERLLNAAYPPIGNPGVTCYLAVNNMDRSYKIEEDLRVRMKTLEKLYNDNQINDATYKQSLENITNEIEMVIALDNKDIELEQQYNAYLLKIYRNECSSQTTSFKDFIKQYPDKVMNFDDYINDKLSNTPVGSKRDLIIYLTRNNKKVEGK